VNGRGSGAGAMLQRRRQRPHDRSFVCTFVCTFVRFECQRVSRLWTVGWWPRTVRAGKEGQGSCRRAKGRRRGRATGDRAAPGLGPLLAFAMTFCEEVLPWNGGNLIHRTACFGDRSRIRQQRR